MLSTPVLLSASLLALASGAFAQAAHHYAVILEDPPVAERFAGRERIRSEVALTYRRQIQKQQEKLRAVLATKKVGITGATDTLLNAIFVTANARRVAELQQLPGVRGVVEIGNARRLTNKATQLVNAPAAWTAVGGVSNGGAGVKIAILDTGIDQTHPAFQDSSLVVPAGFPMCSGFDGACSAFTNNKVIVARSYVKQIAAGSDPARPAADSRPDDYTPRDRDGHGTAVASIAAAVSNGQAFTFNGVAPKAFLGNYKVFGSPNVNDAPPASVFAAAIEQAVKDGMDIINISAGFVATSGPLDTGAACGLPANIPCNPLAVAADNAVKAGVVVVAAAGNNGFDGDNYPSFNTIATPADVPSVIAVGATLNSHIFFPSVSVMADGAPANLQAIAARPSDAISPNGSVVAPLVDVSQIGDDGFGCTGFTPGSLAGSFALIQRGGNPTSCPFADKVDNAVAAGAIGVIIYMADASATITPTGIFPSPGPVVMISNADGVALKSYIDTNPGQLVSIDAAGVELDGSDIANLLASFSSFGPSTGDALLKPEVVAPGGSDPIFFFGAGMYVAAQNYDPAGGIYSANRYAAVDSFNFAAPGASGTSLAAPLVAGAAALVKQLHPTFTPAQVKSALVNTANATAVTQDDQGNDVDLQSIGSGLLDVGGAAKAGVVSSPATFSFGAVAASSLPATQQVQFTNTGSSPVTMTLAVAPNFTGSGVTPTLDKTSLTLAPNASGTVSLALTGASVNPGSWSGYVTVQGAGTTMQIPYLYLVPDGTVANIIPEVHPKCGAFLDNSVGQDAGSVQIKVVDDVGLPVVGSNVTFSVAPRTGATLQNVSAVTDRFGIARAEVIFGSTNTNLTINAAVGRVALQNPIGALIRNAPAITAGGVAGAGNSDASKPVAIGSLISITGTDFSSFSDQTPYPRIPLALDNVMVSFDVPSANLSVPGHVVAIGPTQVFAQVPWELKGQASAQMKVTANCSYSNVVTVSLADYNPAWFERTAGVVFAIDANGQAITTANPAKSGQQITLIANGLGPVTNQPDSGDAGPSSPRAQTTTAATVTIGGQSATVSSSYLTPGVGGQYSVALTVPAGVSGASPVALTIGGQTSKTSNLPVQ